MTRDLLFPNLKYPIPNPSSSGGFTEKLPVHALFVLKDEFGTPVPSNTKPK
jgi:hypothetical protein